MEIKVLANKKAIIWDLDGTLYVETPEFKDMLDEATAWALIKDLGLNLDFETTKNLVKESYKQYRYGSKIFIRDYGVDPEALFHAYHKRKPVNVIQPTEGLVERLKELPYEQYVFTGSSRDVAEKILKHIGLYDFFENKFYSVEDFGIFAKNEDAEAYRLLCNEIGLNPQDCVLVDDSYSNLELAKETGMSTVRIFYKDNSAKDKTYIDDAYRGINAFLDAVGVQNSCKAFVG